MALIAISPISSSALWNKDKGALLVEGSWSLMSDLRLRGMELEKGEKFFIQPWWGMGEGGRGKALMETDRTACCVNTYKQRQKGST